MRVVISIDFELRWGVQDRLGDDFETYRANLEGVSEAIPAILEVFERHMVHATWAVVGAVACENWDEYEGRAPSWPRYRNASLGWNRSVRRNDPNGRLYFAPALVERVRCARDQELGSHTLSHLYMAEPGFMRRDALADTAAVIALFQDRWQVRPRSFVFPRNQIAFEDVLSDAGFEIWRGNPTPFFWNATTMATRSSLVRALRLADSLAPLGRRAVAATDHRASYFVRFNLPDILWHVHVQRIVREARSLRDGQVLHLWWHPHNLGVETKKRVARLENLLVQIREVAPTVQWTSMGELVP